jgi:hypothetical protein
LKTRTLNQLSIRTISAVAVLFAALFFTGCVVTSIYPYYTDKDLVLDPALPGTWVDADTTNASPAHVRIEQVGEKAYLATVLDTDGTNSTELHLFRLKQQLFIDACPTNRSLDFVPVHQVSKVTQLGPGLVETANLNYDWLSKLVEKNPRAIRHMVLRDNPGDEHGSRIVLTADTKDLQRFILKYLDNTNAWKGPSQLKRLN